jgi:bifunctional non-homologous end joining protein LigD
MFPACPDQSNLQAFFASQALPPVVIGGYTPPEGSRKYLGALLVGYHGREGLLFAGRVGTGFSERALATMGHGHNACSNENLPLG